MIAILLVMLGGGIGAMLRALVTDICNRKFNSTIPIATPIVNIIGSFLIGIIMGISISHHWISPFFITGVLGGLTTFSTLSNELVHFLTPKFKLGHFIGYSLLQFLIGFIACYLGFHI
ncbi:fluoride efflux transporter FluC [Staphylococcus caprae]|uniref:fluoride efflux transporter FluC n=1 Tax=Staphylococcus caprae TaxID=29380 RepID=UPI003B214273